MNILEYLENTDITQQSLADLLGVTQGTVYQWSLWFKWWAEGGKGKKPDNALRMTAERAAEADTKTRGAICRKACTPDRPYLWS